jgi:signal transduction histidine kinase
LRDEHLKAWMAVENGLSSISEIVVAMKALACTDDEHGGRFDANINEILRNAALVTRGQWGAVADLSFELDESLPLVPVLAGELGLVFTNLIINASHAVIDRAADARGKISIRSFRREDQVEIEVRDSGCGIRDEIKDRVFEPFFTTKEVGRGSGQGLSLAYSSIVQRHGGRLSFESSTGIGTTFRVTLPIQNATPSASPTGRAGGPQLRDAPEIGLELSEA